MEPYMGLIKFRGIYFDRIGEDEFIVHLVDEEGKPLMTFEPRIIEEGDAYQLKFPNDLVSAALKLSEV